MIGYMIEQELGNLLPMHIFELSPAKWLLEIAMAVISAGGGVIPPCMNPESFAC